MKILITGKDGDVAKAIIPHLRSLGHEIFTYSKATGHNLEEDYTKIKHIEADVYFLCADVKQYETILDFWNNNKKAKILVMGSRAYTNYQLQGKRKNKLYTYGLRKKHLDDLVRELQVNDTNHSKNSKLKITIFNMGELSECKNKLLQAIELSLKEDNWHSFDFW